MSTPPDPGDPLVGVAGFAHALAAAGLPVASDAVAGYARALRQVDVGDPGQVYWAGRATLCRGPDDIPRYDSAFAGWFGGDVPARIPRSGELPRRARIAALTTSDGGDAEGGGPQLRVAADDTEVLRHRDIAELTAAERAHLAELIAALRPRPPSRPAIRMRPARRGAVDPRRTVRSMLAAGGETVRPSRHRKATRPRRVVLLIDVSGSMSPYADALLRFAHVVARGNPTGTEVFTLGTRMTRVSRALRVRDPEVALAAAGRAVPDWAGGTRLGETLRAFLNRWGRRGVARGAVVVIFSDGWERGDPTLLAEQMAQLRRLARTVLWVNPHAGADGYEPVQSGIAAALPHTDRLLAGHSLATLQELLALVRRA
ncbi:MULTISPECIES: VWA domain-containing protein [unclassified Rhodococcus (in: high G+C Gram-positive bacteria)]|uniref:vWA domain-containing protein n=1 Tax=unclassified Rhodococcus (in: high G+C Gram-positive bacteria) TaxID=192944 RepID=UPI0016396B4F|nr:MULTISPECIES: VWA domain-containing protein [unclassified Rhodococcus (in: high G+C Gram-positive bacteria)]MBC2639735.1 VWA domain-containing protein [Rhodococcus sp. 3A]MBC2895520.1 VWA domain-containing protein [Rhodococcus sp. 4CII]